MVFKEKLAEFKNHLDSRRRLRLLLENSSQISVRFSEKDGDILFNLPPSLFALDGMFGGSASYKRIDIIGTNLSGEVTGTERYR